MKRNPLFLVTGAAFLIATLDIRYPAYYQLLNLLAFGAASYGAHLSFRQRWTGWFWALAVLALLFNPFVPLRLLKQTWRILDFASALIFCIYYIKKPR